MKNKKSSLNNISFEDILFNPKDNQAQVIGADISTNASLDSSVLTTMPTNNWISNDWNNILKKPQNLCISSSEICPEKQEFSINFNDEYIKIDPISIRSSLYDYEVFAMLETIKEVIISKCGISNEYFDEKYESNKIKLREFYNEKINANEVTKKLLK